MGELNSTGVKAPARSPLGEKAYIAPLPDSDNLKLAKGPQAPPPLKMIKSWNASLSKSNVKISRGSRSGNERFHLGPRVDVGVPVVVGLGEAVGGKVEVAEGEGENVTDGSVVEGTGCETFPGAEVAAPSQAASNPNKVTARIVFREAETIVWIPLRFTPITQFTSGEDHS